MSSSNTLKSKPEFTVHRDVGTADTVAAADGADLSLLDAKLAIDVQDWLTLDGYVKFVGGAAPDVTLIPLMLSTYKDPVTDALVEEYVAQGAAIGPLTEGQVFQVEPFRGKLLMRIDALSNAPTNVRVLLGGARSDNREDR